MEGGQDQARSEKARLRARLRVERAAIDAAAVRAASREIASRLLALPEIAGAGLVHVFWPLEGRNEVDTRPFIDALLARGVRVALPVVTSAPGEAPALAQRLYVHGGLAPGPFGVMQPAGTPVVPAADLDAAIVPALAAGRDGTRLGYGGGFYDAFLAGVDCPVICPVLDGFLLESLPREPHDRPADVVVTESGVVRVDTHERR
jgi:5-formyltetrahydrofolate cyclo-ligase